MSFHSAAAEMRTCAKEKSATVEESLKDLSEIGEQERKQII